jgi:hypothetical protein
MIVMLVPVLLEEIFQNPFGIGVGIGGLPQILGLPIILSSGLILG